MKFFFFVFSVKPKIQIEGLEDPTFTEGESIMVTCLINRLASYSNKILMTWGSESQASTRIDNGDKTYGYIVRMTRTLELSDHGSVVNCTASLTTGESISESKTVFVLRKYQSNVIGLSVLEISVH